MGVGSRGRTYGPFFLAARTIGPELGQESEIFTSGTKFRETPRSSVIKVNYHFYAIY